MLNTNYHLFRTLPYLLYSFKKYDVYLGRRGIKPNTRLNPFLKTALIDFVQNMYNKSISFEVKA